MATVNLLPVDSATAGEEEEEAGPPFGERQRLYLRRPSFRSQKWATGNIQTPSRRVHKDHIWKR